MPYRAAQRRANKIQPGKDVEQVDPEAQESPLVSAIKTPSGRSQQGSYAQSPTSSAYGSTRERSTGVVDPELTGGTGNVPPAAPPPAAITPATGQPWDAPNASKYAPRVVNEGGNTYLTEHGNRRQLQPGEVESATQYRDQFWQQNPTGFMPGVGPQQNSDYRAPRASQDMFGYFAGFDAGNYQNEDRDKSAKYTFADAASASGYVPRTKAEAEEWANQFVVPELEARGYTVHWVQGDKMMVSTRENPNGEVIDFIQGADGENPMFAWQPEGGEGGAQQSPLQNAIGQPANPLTGSGGSVGEQDLLAALMQDLNWRQMLAGLGIKV